MIGWWMCRKIVGCNVCRLGGRPAYGVLEIGSGFLGQKLVFIPDQRTNAQVT